MAHLRKTIRDNVVTTVTGLATTGARVFRSRVYPLEAADLPGILVYTLSESVRYGSTGRPREMIRTVQLVVEAVARVSAGLDNDLDQICLEVEKALVADHKRGNQAIDTRLDGTEITITGDGDKPIGSARMSWLVDYAHIETTPDALHT